MSAAVERELNLLFRAGYRVVVLETFEEDRALRLLERAAGKSEREFHAWSLAAGWDGSGEGAGSLDLGLTAIRERTEPGVFVILDAHAVVQDAMAMRRLRDLASGLSGRRQTVVLVAPVLELPMELEREATHVQLPLPTAPELRRLFDRVAEATPDGQVDETAMGDCVRAALGLTGAEAVRVFRKAWMDAGAVDATAVARIVGEKRKALRLSLIHI